MEVEPSQLHRAGNSGRVGVNGEMSKERWEVTSWTRTGTFAAGAGGGGRSRLAGGSGGWTTGYCSRSMKGGQR